MPSWLFVSCVAVYGVLIGSFCNVVIWRVPRGESVVRPGSACPACGQPIPARFNVPVAGWLVLRGRSACCSTPISARYPLIESAVGVVWALMAVAVGQDWVLVVVLPYAAGAVCVTAIDVEHYRIPTPLNRALALFAFVGCTVVAVAEGDPAALFVPAGCGLAAAGMLFALHVAVPRGMGMGDVRFAFPLGVVVGACAGWPGVGVAMFVAFASGGVIGGLVVWVKRKQDRRIPFGPSLVFGSFVAIVATPAITGFYTTFSDWCVERLT